MAPRDLPFFRNFNLNNHDVLIQKNICHTFNHNNNSTTLLKNRLKTIKEKFVAVNNYYLKDIYFEAAFSSPSIGCVDVTGCVKNENSWLVEIRSITYLRLELMRKTMVTQKIQEKIEVWQKKKNEMSQTRKFEVFKPKFQREDILIKKENYKLILDQIQQRTNTEQTFKFNYQQRSREICFKATLAKAVLIVSNINNYFNNELLVLNIGKKIDVFYSMKSKLDILKNITFVEQVSLVTLQNLVKDLTSFKNNVVMPVQVEIETDKVKIGNKNKLLNTYFTVNIPKENELLNARIKRQYCALAKNNKALLQNLNAVKNLPFKNDPTSKLLRQNIIKIINTLINTISSTNLTDKYNKLNALLSGKLVCMANTQVIIGSNKEALAFCMETLVTKIINYAEEVISVKAQSAYEIAAVMVKLWAVHQQFGKILYAEIKKKCPLLVPFCYPVAKSLTVQLLDKNSFGYKYDLSGNVESHNKYLKRMTGIVRLYAALIVTSPKYKQPVIGLGHAWVFVAGTLNQNPVADITATMLVEFLNIVGFSMHLAYGKQFIKLLQYINSHYLKKVILVTPSGHGGPITRLNSFLSKHLCTGLFEEPKGMLSSNFW